MILLRHPLVALGTKTVLPIVLVGGAALALGSLMTPTRAAGPDGFRLVLHARSAGPGEAFMSAWNDGDVFLTHDASDHKTVTFTRRGDEHDGCAWLATERLVPIAARAYHYSYQETILSCRPDAHPFHKTPRTGLVTVEPVAGVVTPTALAAVQEPLDLWNVAVSESDCDVDEDDVADDIAQAQQEIDEAMREANQALREANQAMREAQDVAANSAQPDDE